MLDLLKFSITAKNNTGNAFSGVKKELGGVKGMLAGVQDRANRVGKSMRNIGAGMSLGVTAPIAAMGKQMVGLYDTQMKAEAAVGTAIKSTGGAAGKSLSDLKDLASGLQEITVFGDEDILRNVTAPLLTFTKIHGEVFGQAQETVLDYATLMKTDLSTASVMVGKALNDPIKGVAALGKAGVQFTDDQKGMIKSLVEGGDAAGAQALVLKELQFQFEGQARAAALTPLGQWDQLSGLIGDVKEQLGEQIVPFLKPVAVQAKAAIKWLGDLSPEVKRNIVVIGGLAAAVGPLVAGMGLLVMGVTAVGGAFATMGALLLANPLFLAIAVMAGGAYLIYRNWDGIDSWFERKFGSLHSLAGNFSSWMSGKFSVDQQAARDNFMIIWSGLPDFGGDIWTLISSDSSNGIAEVKRVLNNFTLQGILQNAFDGIGPWVSSKWDEVRNATDLSWASIRENLATNYSPQVLIYSAWSGIGDWFAGLSGGIAQAFVQIWDAVTNETTTWPEKMKQVGRDVVGGLISGLKDVPLTPQAVIMDVGRGMVDSIKGVLKSKSPSRVFMGIGKDVVDGLAIGLQDNAKTAIGGMVELGRGLIVEAENNISIIGSFRDGAKSIFTSVLTRAQTFKGALSGILGGIGSNLMNTGASSLFDAIWPFAKGGAFSGGNVVPFAKGGVVNSPTLFGMSGGTGLMGEAGPEAIMPLSRGSDGSLGVRAQYRDRGTKAQSEQHFKFTIVMDPSTAALGGFITDTAGEMIARAEPLTIQKSLGAVDRRMSQTRTFGSAP